MGFPRPDPAAKAFFDEILPDDPRAEVRPMFGNIAVFAGGQMFGGVFGDQVFVRLPEDERARLLEEPGSEIFTPLDGRAMKEYVVLPLAWRDDPERARPWLQRSLAWVMTLPPKAKPTKARPPKTKTAEAKPARPGARKKSK